MNRRSKLMYTTFAVLGVLAAAIILWLLFTVDDWSRDFHVNWAQTSSTAKKASLRPVVAGLSPQEMTSLVTGTVRDLPNWELVSQEDVGDEVIIKLVRTTRMMRFRDDITVHIRPAAGGVGCGVNAESRSRVGRGDLGQNPRNLAELMDKVRAALR